MVFYLISPFPCTSDNRIPARDGVAPFPKALHRASHSIFPVPSTQFFLLFDRSSCKPASSRKDMLTNSSASHHLLASSSQPIPAFPHQAQLPTCWSLPMSLLGHSLYSTAKHNPRLQDELRRGKQCGQMFTYSLLQAPQRSRRLDLHESIRQHSEWDKVQSSKHGTKLVVG